MKHVLPFLIIILCSPVLFAAAGKDITYTIANEPFQGYYVSAGKNAPLVLLLHDWDGLTDYETQRADMLAEMGYSVFAADLFGAGIRPTLVEDKRQHTGELYQDRGRMRALLNGALQTAGDQGGNIDNLVVMGYCFGGAAVLEMARSGVPAKGYVTFHGGLQTPEGQDYSKAQGSLLILHGTADTAITMDQFAQLATELERAGIKHEMITYSGAPHAFTVFGAPSYRKDADEKSWQRFTEFLTTVSR
ncbi:dienelactone hydrolase family protein [Gynuella sunshinyii]|uniref:Dienelactone hydrolase-related enzyme n=1 Tax=Gynuella sunshinyii YC6258 TaxID=1445510 RepID=A0A0C5V2X3_9GAMM|nr:dienelactone hydrolase family protein [Gynuella sunshinyii]AJQ93860.1 dienelactone hydrolase-related enzyme [Gynuella sunshinyii YC6258]